MTSRTIDTDMAVATARRPAASAALLRLEEGYSAAVDVPSAGDWYDVVASFRDVNVYQVWERERRRVSRLVVRRGERVVAAAEVRLFTVPATRWGIAYVRWGPLWRRGDGDSVEVLRQALRALRNEYVVRRGLVLRVVPWLTTAECPEFGDLAREEGYTAVPWATPDRTLVLPLTADLSELRRNFNPKWRNHLNQAERAGLTVTVGTGVDLIDQFTIVYRQMLQRKGFAPTADVARHRLLQARLPEAMKMGVLLARHEGRLCAGVIYSAMGDTALYLFGATNALGMRTSASYLLQWETMKTLKRLGVRAYDLHGINPVSNPGTYSFKRGLAGRAGSDVSFVGPVQALRGTLVDHLVLRLDQARHRLRAARAGRQHRTGSTTTAVETAASDR